MSRLDEAIASAAYILDSLKTLRNIYETGSCNECSCSKLCQVCPKPGQMGRYNCPFFVKEEKDGKL